MAWRSKYRVKISPLKKCQVNHKFLLKIFVWSCKNYDLDWSLIILNPNYFFIKIYTIAHMSFLEVPGVRWINFIPDHINILERILDKIFHWCKRQMHQRHYRTTEACLVLFSHLRSKEYSRLRLLRLCPQWMCQRVEPKTYPSPIK